MIKFKKADPVNQNYCEAFSTALEDLLWLLLYYDCGSLLAKILWILSPRTCQNIKELWGLQQLLNKAILLLLIFTYFLSPLGRESHLNSNSSSMLLLNKSIFVSSPLLFQNYAKCG